MDKVNNKMKNHGAGGGAGSPDGPKDEGETGFLPVTAAATNPVSVQAGGSVTATEQVNHMDISLSSSDTNLEDQISSINIKKSNCNLLIRNKSEEASSYIQTGNNTKEALSHTELGKSLNNSEIDIFESKIVENDDFSPNKTEFFETSLNPADITFGDSAECISNINIIKEKKTKYSGAAKLQYKRQKREEAKKEIERNETGEEKEARLFVEKTYNIRNKSYAQAAKAAGGMMLEVRCHNQDYLLEQADFDKIDLMCGKKFLELWRTGDKADYVMSGGLSQGGVWISCKNQVTLDLVKGYTGTLSSTSDVGRRGII